MTRQIKVIATLIATALFVSASAQASDDPKLLDNLRDAKFSLLDAITFAESSSGPATSAKFEMDGDQLVFSVYTAPQGLSASPEATDLTELSGSATQLPIQSKAEIFADKEHIARASVHQTLMQLSNLTLKEVILKALRHQNGIVYSVKNPLVRNHRAVADVSILTPEGRTEVVTINLQ
jgi:hypothetical protein